MGVSVLGILLFVCAPLAFLPFVLCICATGKTWRLWRKLAPARADVGGAHSSDNLDTVRVLTLNVFLRQWSVRNWGGDHKDERLSAIVREVFSRYDVVCVQEAFVVFSHRGQMLIDAAAEAGFPYYAAPAYPGACGVAIADSGLFIFSRFPIDSVTRVAYRRGQGSDRLVVKEVQHAAVRIADGLRFHVLNTHMQSTQSPAFVAPWRRALMREQACELRQFLDSVQTPVLLCGDFNCDRTDELYADLMARLGFDAEQDEVTSIGTHPVTHPAAVFTNPHGVDAADRSVDAIFPRHAPDVAAPRPCVCRGATLTPIPTRTLLQPLGSLRCRGGVPCHRF